QYGEPGYLLDLADVEEYIDFTTFEDSLLGTGRLNDVQYSLPTGYSMWANFINDDLLAEYEVAAPDGGSSFSEFDDWMTSFTASADGEVYGGTDYTQRIQTFELMLRAQGKNLYTEDGEL